MLSIPIPHINRAPFEYWSRSRYTPARVDQVCRELDSSVMAARLVFDGKHNLQATVSKKTWERQEGHYPSVVDYFGEIARQPRMAGKRGSFIVLLEDGLWNWFLPFATKAPILSFGRHRQDNRSFVMPDPAYFKTHAYEDEQAKLRILVPKHPWHSRRPTVFWRGASTGLGIEAHDWRKSARGVLTTFARDLSDPTVLDAKFSKVKNVPPEQQQLFHEEGLVDAAVPFEEFLTYRYLIDADGYCCAWQSLFLKLLSGSATLKMQSEYEQWYHRDLIPWRHYIPLASDLSDFRDAYEWLRAHDDKAQLVAEEARTFLSELSYRKTLDEMTALCAALLECCDASPDSGRPGG